MSLFSIPKTDYTDHYDLARFSLSWRVCIFMAFALSLLGILLFILEQPASVPTFFGAFSVIGFLIILQKTRKYGLVAIIFTVLGTALCQFTLISFVSEYHMVDVMWIMVTCLYTFFMLGKKWGVINLAFNIIGIIVFILFRLNENLTLIGQLEEGKVIALAFNFAICGLLVTFLILQFLKVIQKAENDFRAINNELKEQNTTVAIQNEEKTVMLREIHHRVKNNLQVITSLLRLQSGEIHDEESQEKFEETINRVRSMAHIHERMYKSENLSKIDLENYIESLAEDLIHSYNIRKRISLTVECEIIEVDPKALVSLALIFNELISNSLKHAFETTEKPIISIDLRMEGDDRVELYYSDNGQWKMREKKSFGLELIDSLTDQLNGTLEIEANDEGTHFTFDFEYTSILDQP